MLSASLFMSFACSVRLFHGPRLAYDWPQIPHPGRADINQKNQNWEIPGFFVPLSREAFISITQTVAFPRRHFGTVICSILYFRTHYSKFLFCVAKNFYFFLKEGGGLHDTYRVRILLLHFNFENSLEEESDLKSELEIFLSILIFRKWAFIFLFISFS